MYNDAIDDYHAVVILAYFISLYTGLAVYPHPYILILTICVCLVTFIAIRGVKKTLKSALMYVLLGVICIVFNMLINHRGPTELMMIYDLRITYEAMLYGLQIALLMIACLYVFSLMSSSLDDAKVLMLFSHRTPRLALLFSMILRLIPSIKHDISELRLYNGTNKRAFMTLTQMTLESGIVRSISMKDRGYETGNTRTGYYRKSLRARDVAALFIIILFASLNIFIRINKLYTARYFPSVKISSPPVYLVILWGVYLLIPLILMIKENVVWLISKRRIIDTDIMMQKMS